MMSRTCPKVLVQANNGLHHGGFILFAGVPNDHEID